MNKVYKLLNILKKNIILFPIFVIVAIIPLIVRYKEYNPNLQDFSWFSNVTTWSDFFLYYKQLIFVGIIWIAFLILIFKFFISKVINNSNILKVNGKYKFTIALVPVLIYGAMAIMSTIFSEYSYYSYNGIFEQFETIFVLIGYCFIIFYCFIFINSIQDIKCVTRYLTFGVTIMVILGLGQCFKLDFFRSTLGNKLILPQGGVVNFIFPLGQAYLSLYNPNYVGLYVALIAPIFLTLCILNENKAFKIFYYFIFISLLLCIVSSQARNGFVAFCCSLVLLFIFLRKRLIAKLRYTIMLTILSLAILISYSLYINNGFFIRLQNSLEVQEVTNLLSEIITDKNYIEITYDENKLYLQSEINENVMNFYPYVVYSEDVTNNTKFEDAIKLDTYLDVEQNMVYISDDRFKTFQITPVNCGECYGYNVIIDNHSWVFSNFRGDNEYYFYNSYGKWDKMEKVETAIFSREYESLGSYRGYIWSRTIPLLKDYIFLGSGADTFAIVFPQNDYVGMYNTIFENSLITKPHNLYLQIGVQTGVISLIAFLVFYGIYFFTSIKLYIKSNFDNYAEKVGIGIFLGSIGYMVSAIFNDSTVTVSPIYWTLMGIGLAINYYVKNNLSKENIV